MWEASLFFSQPRNEDSKKHSVNFKKHHYIFISMFFHARLNCNQSGLSILQHFQCFFQLFPWCKDGFRRPDRVGIDILSPSAYY